MTFDAPINPDDILRALRENAAFTRRASGSVKTPRPRVTHDPDKTHEGDCTEACCEPPKESAPKVAPKGSNP